MICTGMKEAIARFLFILATMLVAMLTYDTVIKMFYSRPVLIPLEAKFKVLTKTVKPGDTLTYHIRYFKRLEIPGHLFKQLVIKDKEGQEHYLPLEGFCGNLPTGEVDKLAHARIPDWAPEGTGYVTLTSTHYSGRIQQVTKARTETFKVAR